MGYCVPLMRQGAVAACGTVLAMVLAASPARAQRVVVGDLAGSGDESGAVTLLLRSMLRTGQRPAVPLGELMLALQRAPAARQGGFGIERDHAGAIMKDVGADRALFGELTGDERVALSVHIVGPAGERLAATTVQSVRGDVAQLALEAANRLAKDGGVTVTPVDASLGELRPFVRASRALGTGDLKGAAQALRVAGRDVAGRVSAAKDVADAIWRNTQLPTDLRIVAALAAGESQEAVNLGRADTSKNPDVRAQQLRAELATSDLKAAQKSLATIKTADSDAALLARAEYDLKKNKTADAARELTPLLSKKPPSSAALALIGTLPPGTLDPATEGLAVTAAHGVEGIQPGVASLVGLRAARGGNKSADAVSLLKPDEMRPMELADVDKLMGEAPSALAKSVAASVQQRRDAKVVELKDDGKKPKVTTVAPPVAADVSPQVRTISQLLQPLLGHFPQLAGAGGGTVVIYPIKGGSPFWAPYRVRRAPLGYALQYALSSPPHHLGAILRHEVQDEHLAAGDLEALANAGDEGAQLVMLYRCTADGSNARVELQLYSVADGKLYLSDESIAGEATGLVRLNPIVIPAGALLALGLLVFVVMRFLRVGEVTVDIKRDPGAEKEMLVVLISKKDKPPAIADLEQFHRTTQTRRGRLVQFNAPARTTFPRVPAGKHWVHAYGTYEKGGEIRAMPAGISQAIVVKFRDTHRVQLELDPNTTEYRVHVVDGEPVAGATIIVDEDRSAPVTTDREGNATIHLSRGQHVLHVSAGGEKFDKHVDVNARKLQMINIALPAERLKRERVGGIALSDDDAAPRPAAKKPGPVASSAPEAGSLQTSPPRTTEPAPEAPDVDGVTEAIQEPHDDGVSLPEGFHIPALGVAPPVAKPPAANPPAAKPTVAKPPVAKPAASGLGRYRKGAELARDGAGVVFKGRDTVLDRDVAIKVLSAAKPADAQTLETFLREGRSLVGLDHPNLVTVFELGVDGGEPFQVMELVAGQTLESLMRTRGCLPMDELLVIADQICTGLAFAHEKRIVHRNLKPASILLASDGAVKISDFAAPPADGAYVSPEQRRGEAPDARSDLYSVGCTLFQLACGQPPPASGATPKASSINADVHPDFDKLVQRCLERDRAARIASADDLRKLIKPLKAIYC